MVFLDTTSIYFEEEGGETPGEYGNRKDNPAEGGTVKQTTVAAVLEESGRALWRELWLGNRPAGGTDVEALVLFVDRLKRRFQIGSVGMVAERGNISKGVIQESWEGALLNLLSQ